MQSQVLAGYLFGLLGVAIFGGTVPMTRIGVASFDPWFITFGRAALAGIVALAILSVTRPALPKGSGPRLVAISLALVIGFPALAGMALVTVPAAHGAVVLGIMPVTTAVAAVLLAGERPTPLFWALSLTGAALVAFYSLRHGAGGLEPGDILLGLAAISASIGYGLSGRLSRAVPGWAVICWALAIALPLTIPATALLWRAEYVAAPVGAWGAFLYLSLFSMLVGFFAWNAGLALGGVAHVGQVQLLQVFFSLVITALIVNETIAGEDLLFAGLVTAVVALTGKARRPASPPPKPVAIVPP